MKLFLITLLMLCTASGFYDLKIEMHDGSVLPLSRLKGRKILIVNVASRSEGVSQLPELQDLQEKYKNSLTVILIPSNSFRKEPLQNSKLRSLFTDRDRKSGCLLAAKASVSGLDALDIYKWLADEKLNGVSSFTINENFQKILISEKGTLIGVFSGAARMTGEAISKAIESAY